jgi:hypothetical protein
MDPKSGIEGFTLIYVPEPWEGVSHGKYEVKCGVNADRNTSTYDLLRFMNLFADLDAPIF